MSSRINALKYYPVLINSMRNILSSISRKTSVLNSIFILVKVLKLIFGLGASLKMSHLKRLFFILKSDKLAKWEENAYLLAPNPDLFMMSITRSFD